MQSIVLSICNIKTNSEWTGMFHAFGKKGVSFWDDLVLVQISWDGRLISLRELQPYVVLWTSLFYEQDGKSYCYLLQTGVLLSICRRYFKIQQWNKIQLNELFERMKKYRPNINLILKVNHSKFLDTKIYCDNNEVRCFSYRKEIKLPFHWTSAVTKQYKNTGDLHRVKNLKPNFPLEIRIIRDK